MAPTRYPGEEVSADPLGAPLDYPFSGKSAPNRFLKAAMAERLSSWSPTDVPARGIPSPELINAYRRWGEGGFGTILTGNTMIDYENLEAAGNPILPRDATFSGPRFDAFREMAHAAKSGGGLVLVQLSHPGRQVGATLQKHPISASDVQLEPRMGIEFAKPRPATEEDLRDVIESFAHAAEFASKAGYDGVQLHGAHGYLLSQFLSPTTNHRTDKYGGSLENRSRLILEVAQEIRRRVPSSFILGIKVNSVEFQDKGFDTEECRQLCAALEANKFDFVELSGGTYQEIAFGHRRESTRKREAFFLEFAEAIVPALKHTKVFVTGGLRTVGAMVNALKTVDGVGLARPACQEFDFPNKVLKDGVKGSIKWALDEDDFMLGSIAGGSMIRMVGKDQQPIDLSDKDNVALFQKSMGSWMEKMQNDKQGSLYGFVDMVDFTPQQYKSLAQTVGA